MQNAIAQHQQKKEKKSLGTLSSTARANRTRIDGKARIAATVAQAGLFFSATDAPFTRKKHNVLCKSSPSNRILAVSVPMRSANSDLLNKIRLT